MARASGKPKKPASLPTGTVTFLFTDIEGSTQRWEADHAAMDAAVTLHDALVRRTIELHHGYVFKTVGDAFCAAFSQPKDAARAAVELQQALAHEDFTAVDGLHVRIGMHVGETYEREGDYFGSAVNRVARLMSIAHGGQVLISSAVHERIKSDLPAGVSLVDMGARRLKDLTHPEQVWQVNVAGLPAEFPPLNSLDARPNNLPIQVTSLIGREQDLVDVRSLIGKHRVVTISGSGGVGKTRVALQAGADLIDRFDDGAWFADLAPIRDPELVASVVAKVLNISAPEGKRLDEAIPHALRHKKLLLILDNCEQVLDVVVGLADAIQRSAPDVRILATSRQVLGIDGEAAHRLPSLAVPETDSAMSADEALRYGAIAVFADRATLADSCFALTDDNAPAVVDICRRLDGIPLALELAAARVKVLSISNIAQRLSERFKMLTGGSRTALPRQRTLGALIDWSYDLLTPQEQALFRRLSVFSNGWTLRAATEVCNDEGVTDEWAVLDVLSSLVDKSLVVVDSLGDDKRYRMLNSIREYGLERLSQTSEAEAIAAKHARFYAAFVRGLSPLVRELEDVEWRRHVVAELDNIRSVIERTVQRHEPEVGLALLADLEWPELVTTPQEALRWFAAAAELPDAAADARVYSRMLRHCVLLEYLVGRPLAHREKSALRALEIARSTDDADEIARALASLGACYRAAGRFEEAERVFEDAYKTPELLSRITTNAVLRIWAVTDLQRGEVELARKRFSEVTRLERPGSEAHA
ncbi:MAG: adenylate/guanylate cyclase domain-containing protein, partial [Candidatus Tumulicola sp.]